MTKELTGRRQKLIGRSGVHWQLGKIGQRVVVVGLVEGVGNESLRGEGEVGLRCAR